MSLKLSENKPNNFARVIAANPQLLTCCSYLNFLRHYKTQHPRFGLRRILQNGFTVWSNLNNNERRKFKQREGYIKPRLKRLAKYRRTKIPRLLMPRSARKRNLIAQKDIQRRKRNLKPLRKYRPKRLPVYYK